MKHIKKEVSYPLRLVDEEGDVTFYYDVEDLKCNLEDFDSKKDTGFLLTDAKGFPVHLRMSLMSIEFLEVEEKC